MDDMKIPSESIYGDVPFHLEYSDVSMFDEMEKAAEKFPKFTALSFMGTNVSYKKLVRNTDIVARAFKAAGVGEGDRVTLCLPNIPQTVYCMYALNKIGAIASMIHPLSAEGEIVTYLNTAESKYIVTLDQFFDKIDAANKTISIDKIIVTSISDALSPIKAAAYRIASKKNHIDTQNSAVITWKDFIAAGKACVGSVKVEKKATDPAIILFSGGTTGIPKAIMLSNLNFNALGVQTIAMSNNFKPGMSMLAAMPMFHGFGLGVCIHTMLISGGKSILVPRFNVKSYSKLLKTEQPNFIAGVPTLYEAITRNPYMKKVSLKCLKGVFSGGDNLSVELKKKFDKFLADHGAEIRIREGYGATECVAASCLTPYNKEKEGSIGLPFPDTYYAICAPETTTTLPFGEEGEICICGPTVMLGYMNNPEETASTLIKHDDGKIWLHTGDLGYMDEDGFVYFKQRLKRMIVTSGYNVYPSQLESIIDKHEYVSSSCVIGVKDDYKMQKVKAFVILNDGVDPDKKTKDEIMAYCRRNIAKFAMPYDIEFRKELPRTRVGKIAYAELEKESASK